MLDKHVSVEGKVGGGPALCLSPPLHCMPSLSGHGKGTISSLKYADVVGTQTQR